MNLDALRRHCEAGVDRMVETTSTLATLESPTSDKGAADACGAEIVRQFRSLGAQVETFPQTDAGDHVRARWGTGGPRLLLLGHFDTVWPVGQVARMPVVHEDGVLRGPGVYDMKAGIALGLYAVEALQALDAFPPAEVSFLLTSDEERGSATSRALVEETARGCAAVLVLEPSLPGGTLKTARKGAGEFILSVTGVSAHAGIEPGQGASAIHELARQIVGVEALRDDARGVSVNVGLVEGGSRPNVVAETARASIDVRVATQADGRDVQAALQALAPHDPRIRLQVDGGFSRPPLERSDGVARLYKVAAELASALGYDLDEGSTGGGSDGNLTAALGVPTLDGLGAVGDGGSRVARAGRHRGAGLAGRAPWPGSSSGWGRPPENEDHEQHVSRLRFC